MITGGRTHMASGRASRSWVGAASVVLVFTAGAVLGCSAPAGPEGAVPWSAIADGGGTPDAGGSVDSIASHVSALCTPPRASEALTPRVDLMGMAPMKMAAGPKGQVIQTADLFSTFNTFCGACHVTAANGGRQTSAATFSIMVDSVWVASIMAEDPAKAMPPPGQAFSTRSATDPIRKLASSLQLWIAAGRPKDSFVVNDPSAAPADDTGGVSGYTFTPDMAAGMSNLGTCVPDKPSYMNSPSTEMEAKDTMFAAATELPNNLSDTDLVTFDTSVLAANGVIAFVPAYPLWSDGSGKLRYIRVPKGTSVKFDKKTQTFQIPPNTRFYKTFFRKVTDISGKESYRKIETRLIVARPESLAPDGSIVQNALYGTYLWNPEETAATLHTAEYRDGNLFRDKTLEYVTDELLYEEVLDSVPPGASVGFEDRKAEALSMHPGLVQHYAVPGKIRCDQCHRGSPTNDFVLGFFPLQIARRPDGVGGTYEPTGADELTQLQRLIDYGVITGMESPGDVLTLEESQAPRHNRTHEELVAQGYMVGNCAHCHNPHGYPSILKPELAPLLNFMPSAGQDGGGIFEFPLTRVSPIRQRGANRDIPIPYITPSLRDYPVVDEGVVRMDSRVALDPGFGVGHDKTYTPKYLPDAESGGPAAGGCASLSESDRKLWCGDRRAGHTFVDGPWRSLIYRNVDTPFAYYDDYVPFPHMPMNTAGFDGRAPRLIGDWMISIPAVRADPDAAKRGHGEDDLPSASAKAHDGSYDDSPQPYVEVKPGDPAYPEAVIAARGRLAAYHAGIRYNYREEVLGTDIVDEILSVSGLRIAPHTMYLPDPTRYLFGGIAATAPGTGQQVFPAIGVPYHSHWFDYDPTDSTVNWEPRRANAWKGVLLDGLPDPTPPLGVPVADFVSTTETYAPEILARTQTAAALAKADLTDALRTYATTPVAYGLWKVKPECQARLAGVPKVSEFTGPTGPWWITKPLPTGAPAPDAPVYLASPGQMVFRHICYNCHGARADGKGIQTDSLAAASDGDARPANFIGGLFGPLDQPGANLLRVFGTNLGKAGPDALKDAEKLGARYMAWMALGGTLQHIPTDIIHQIEATRILGQQRSFGQLSSFAVSANMLELGKSFCSLVLPSTIPGPDGHFGAGSCSPQAGYPSFASKASPFIQSNGDYEMWLRLCSQFNRPVVRVYKLIDDSTSADPNIHVWNVGLGTIDGDHSLYYGEDYPEAGAVWDQDQQIQHGVDQQSNLYPACFDDRVLDKNDDDNGVKEKKMAATAFLSRCTMPPCPRDFLQKAKPLSSADTITWKLEGAIATGMAVFSYLRDSNTDLGHKPPPPYYDECQLLP